MLDDREIPYIIGHLCDGFDISAEQQALIVAAVAGAVLTDRGPRLYYADLDTMMLPNVDTEEGIWSVADDGILRGGSDQELADLRDDSSAREQGVFPLAAMGDDARMAWWAEAMAHAGNAERRRWAKFLRRVFRPLQRALGQSAR
jgi:hypothetical protein